MAACGAWFPLRFPQPGRSADTDHATTPSGEHALDRPDQPGRGL